MKNYLLEPQVAGHLGRNTIFIEEDARPPLIQSLHYEFDGWLGDDFISSLGIYIGTKALADTLSNLTPKVTGVVFDEVEISKSDEYYWAQKEGRTSAPKELPEFKWFRVIGEPKINDFGIPTVYGIVVSERVLTVLKSLSLNHCGIQEFEPTPQAK